MADLWPAAWGAAPGAEYIPKMGGSWAAVTAVANGHTALGQVRTVPGLLRCVAQETGLPLGKQNLIAARMRSRIVAREKVQSSGVTLKPCLHDLGCQWQR